MAVHIEKLWEFLISGAIAVLSFALFSATAYCRRRIPPDYRLLYSAIFAFSIGVAKVIAESEDSCQPWYSPSCSFNIWDILINLDGVFFGSALGMVMLLLLYDPARYEACDVTEASTIESDEEDNSNNEEGQGCEDVEGGLSETSPIKKKRHIIPVEIKVRLVEEGSDDVGNNRQAPKAKSAA